MQGTGNGTANAIGRDQPRTDWPTDAAQALIADIPTPALPCWSTNGTHLAWLWDAGAGWEVWVTDLGGVPRRVATGAALAQPCWLGNARAILFTQRMAGGTRLAVVDVDTGAVRALTSGPHDRSGQISPDGTAVAFISGRAGALDIWRVATAGGAATQLTEQTNPLDEPRWTPRWSPDGQWIAYVSSRSGERNNDDLWVVSTDGTRHRQLSTGLLVDTDAAWSPDGQTLAVVATTTTEHWYGDDGDVWLVGLEALRPRRLTAAGGATRRGEGHGIGWLPGGEAVYVLRHQNGDTNLTAVRLSDGVQSPITNLHGVISDVAPAPGGATFALVVATQTSPPAVALLTADGGLPTPISGGDGDLTVPLIDPIRMPFRAADGLYCDGYLYLPPGFSGGARYPTLVQVHGGGTNSFGNGWHPIEQFLAQRGFVVFAVEYRGSSGYGRAFADLSWGDWGGGHTRDAIAAAEFLRGKPWVGGVGIYGQSFGGYITLHAVVAAPEAFPGGGRHVRHHQPL